MPTLTNGGGLTLICLFLAVAWIIWYGYRDWKRADRLANKRRADQDERDAANKADDELVRWMNQGKP